MIVCVISSLHAALCKYELWKRSHSIYVAANRSCRDNDSPWNCQAKSVDDEEASSSSSQFLLLLHDFIILFSTFISTKRTVRKVSRLSESAGATVIRVLRIESRHWNRNPGNGVGALKRSVRLLRDGRRELLRCNPPRRLSERHNVIEAGFLSFPLNKTIKIAATRSYRDQERGAISTKSFMMNNLSMNITTIHVTCYHRSEIIYSNNY